ncbi:hypothetical protein BDW74DRAFT_99946 [Aspergillus multicolor]|uniref:uncharacterized protein n=1 Tax=Aspergillus multicolor TaxID=41759 RepID=UPI003CCCE083
MPAFKTLITLLIFDTFDPRTIYDTHSHGNVYIARLCIAWLAASLLLRFMTDRRLGIKNNYILLKCLASTHVYTTSVFIMFCFICSFYCLTYLLHMQGFW